jgi:hypothetical protein
MSKSPLLEAIAHSIKLAVLGEAGFDARMSIRSSLGPTKRRDPAVFNIITGFLEVRGVPGSWQRSLGWPKVECKWAV